jgi:hypothetical protein
MQFITGGDEKRKGSGATCDAKWDRVHSAKRIKFPDLKNCAERRSPHDVTDDL